MNSNDCRAIDTVALEGLGLDAGGDELTGLLCFAVYGHGFAKDQ